jgi:hypothetical protein
MTAVGSTSRRSIARVRSAASSWPAASATGGRAPGPNVSAAAEHHLELARAPIAGATCATARFAPSSSKAAASTTSIAIVGAPWFASRAARRGPRRARGPRRGSRHAQRDR